MQGQSTLGGEPQNRTSWTTQAPKPGFLILGQQASTVFHLLLQSPSFSAWTSICTCRAPCRQGAYGSALDKALTLPARASWGRQMACLSPTSHMLREVL